MFLSPWYDSRVWLSRAAVTFGLVRGIDCSEDCGLLPRLAGCTSASCGNQPETAANETPEDQAAKKNEATIYINLPM